MASTPNITKEEIKEGKGLAIIAYIIALIPFLAGDKKNKFIRFHAVQGMNIFICTLILWAASWLLNSIIGAIMVGSAVTLSAGGVAGSLGILVLVNAVFGLAFTVLGVLDIVGLIYAAQGQAKEIPIINKIKFIKK
ncbi:MAG: hypothetical protein LBT19_01615 [Candidatus Nomurabacteria bacterium]|jgi:uncharacterized membrane protein|nr:hypothetical protein [Candidatus Nomurabacteria bacterium]